MDTLSAKPIATLPPYRNSLLSSIPPEDREPIYRHLRPVDLGHRKQLELPNRAIDTIYFPESGIISIVADRGRTVSRQIEVGIIGRDGMSGLAVILGNGNFPYSSYIQVAGSGYCLDADIVRDVMQRNLAWRRLFLAFAQTFLLQVSETAVANACARIDERLARWLLMVNDRLGADEVPLTHEFLSFMMGSRRAGVTVAIHALAQKGLVENRRGAIKIVNRLGLEAHAGRYYGIPEREYKKLIPSG